MATSLNVKQAYLVALTRIKYEKGDINSAIQLSKPMTAIFSSANNSCFHSQPERKVPTFSYVGRCTYFITGLSISSYSVSEKRDRIWSQNHSLIRAEMTLRATIDQWHYLRCSFAPPLLHVTPKAGVGLMSNKLFQMERPDFRREPPEIQEPILSDVINYYKVLVGYLWVPLTVHCCNFSSCLTSWETQVDR